MAEFTHLHLHTAYSLLDGAIRLPDLFPRILEHGMKSVAMTDHGNMFGALDFYKRAKGAGVKPIFGCETYVSATDRFDRSERRNYHLILLAKDNEGFSNLSYLNSMGYLEGFYYNPRIDKKVLRERSKGLFGLSACLGGEVAQTLMRQGEERAAEVALEYASMFEPGHFFLEMMPNGLPEQEQVNDAWRRVSKKTGIRLVCTNDCHYLNKDDARAHEVLMCIQQGKTVFDERRLHHKKDAYYLKSPAEMDAYFHDIPEAMENAAWIGEQCNVNLDLGKVHLPRYSVPEGETLDSFLGKVAEAGLESRFREMTAAGRPFDPDRYRERLAREVGVICKMGFSGYFLIVWDFIRFAKEKSIPVGPGRGSGAGSLAAYAMRITDIDPLPYNLIFERFLNPERVSMPDFDIDFCMNRRDEVIRYVTEKYGEKNVGQIATMHQMKARLVIRDVARALGFEYGVADKIAKLVPEPIQGKSPPLGEAIKQEPRLMELYQKDSKCKELLDIAKALENLNRHAGMHAAGIVIAEKPLFEYVPCFRGQNGELITQFAKDEVEEMGLVKFDFLGLKTLTVIDNACALIRNELPDFSVANLSLDDPEVYKMISEGDTTGVFQLESSGFRELLKRLRPDCFEDIVAAVALYRPGPLEGGMVDDFIARKHKQKKVEYPHPSLETLLNETYGVIVYQEQVMQIASVMAGYSLGQADLLRRAMGKKKKEVMEKEKANFLAGAEKNNIPAKIAGEVFDLVEVFAGYGFNKSHSAAYALVTVQTAYLKRYFPVEFMAALLTCDKDKTENVVKFIAEARAMGIEVLRPDVNESETDFTVLRVARKEAAPASGDSAKPSKNGQGKRKAKSVATDVGATASTAHEDATRQKVIRFGLGAVKGIGEGAVDAILEARREGGPYLSFFDFCERVDSRRVNRRVIEALVKSGAVDGPSGGAQRSRLFGAVDQAIERAQAAQRDRMSGQISLLGVLEEASRDQGGKEGASRSQAEAAVLPDVEPWSPKELLAFEKESLGFYLSGHPLDRYKDDLRRYATATTADIEQMRPTSSGGSGGGPGGFRGGVKVSVGGLVANFRDRPLKSGAGRMAFFDIEDDVGHIEVICFSKQYEKCAELLQSGEPVLISGSVQFEGDEEAPAPKIRLEDVTALATLRTEKTTMMRLRLQAQEIDVKRLSQLKSLLLAVPGNCATFVHVVLPERSETIIDLGKGYKVSPTDELLAKIERLFGERVAHLA